MICVNHIRCSPRPFVDRPNYDLAKVFFVALRGPPWAKGSCSRRCSSPRPSVSSVDKCVAVAVLRGPPCPPWTNVLPLQFFVFLRGPSWTKKVFPRPFVDRPNYDLAKVFFVALRGPPWTKGSCSRRCSSPRPSVSSVDKCVAVAVLRGPSWPFVDKKGVPHRPSWTNHILTLHSIPGLHQLQMRLGIGIGGTPVLSWLELMP